MTSRWLVRPCGKNSTTPWTSVKRPCLVLKRWSPPAHLLCKQLQALTPLQVHPPPPPLSMLVPTYTPFPCLYQHTHLFISYTYQCTYPFIAQNTNSCHTHIHMPTPSQYSTYLAIETRTWIVMNSPQPSNPSPHHLHFFLSSYDSHDGMGWIYYLGLQSYLRRHVKTCLYLRW